MTALIKKFDVTPAANNSGVNVEINTGTAILVGALYADDKVTDTATFAQILVEHGIGTIGADALTTAWTNRDQLAAGGGDVNNLSDADKQALAVGSALNGLANALNGDSDGMSQETFEALRKGVMTASIGLPYELLEAQLESQQAQWEADSAVVH